MKNMYLAAAMVVSLAFSACSDEESGKADRAYKPIEIYGNINEVVNNVQSLQSGRPSPMPHRQHEFPVHYSPLH